ncbi:porin family protein [Rhodocytophaga aerolata]|uniref:Porin family protein n=1 Tax=Rhodocytophaga aerolata TaxID=455078 RepID=A0ABT8R437_9BACT|nr:porin family protein [Rhodocytophaga aerolata]MDO1446704.1 porin family protein [Rhodocytophaga aerolata]
MRLLFLASLLLYPFFSSTAQTYIGVKAGPNFTQVAFTPSFQQQVMIFYNAGVVFQHFEEKHAGVQLELTFTQKGFKEVKDSVNSYNRTIQYIELPFMSHFYAGTEKSNIFLNLGPYLGYGISAKEVITVDSKVESKSYTFTNADNRFDLGFLAGIGIHRQFKFGILQLEGRISHGLSNILNSRNSIPYSASKNQVISASLLYLIDYKSLKRKRKLPKNTDVPLPLKQE